MLSCLLLCYDRDSAKENRFVAMIYIFISFLKIVGNCPYSKVICIIVTRSIRLILVDWVAILLQMTILTSV